MFKKLAIMAGLAALCLSAPLAAHAQSPAPASPAQMEQRVSDLEAIQTNNPPSAGGLLENYAAPAHNTWIMVSSGLVLFMTLPGLALFYGGLVRRKTSSPSSHNASGSRRS